MPRGYPLVGCCAPGWVDTPEIRHAKGEAGRRRKGERRPYLAERNKSPEMRAKVSAGLKGRARSAEHSAAISRAKTGRAITDKERAALARVRLLQPPTWKWAPDAPGHAALHAYATGRAVSQQTRDKLSKATSERNRRRGTIEYLDQRGRLFRFKSKQERIIAAALDARGLTWDYEPDTLLLPDGRRYTPDFRVGTIYLEVKATNRYRFAAENLDKITLAQDSGVAVILIVTPEDVDLVCV